MKNETQIKCPNCGTSIDVQDILSHQLEEEIKQKYQSQIAKTKKEYELEQEKLKQDKLRFEQAKKRENELFQERLENQLKADKREIEIKLKQKLKDEQTMKFPSVVEILMQ